MQLVPGGVYVDGTLGAGGHTRGLLEQSAPDGRVIAFDRDPEAIALARQDLGALGERVTFVNANFAAMGEMVPALGVTTVDGVLLDLGVSSMQLDSATRGFSFRYDAPLDMRFDPTAAVPTAADLLNTLDEAELAELFWRYGEEPRSRYLAQLIVANRPIHTTAQLADLVARHVKRRGRLHPATQLFQALRIRVNGELDALAAGLDAAVGLLKPGGRLVVISFHSLEDRYVKQLFRDLSQSCICPPRQPLCTCGREARLALVQRKAIQPSSAEIAHNPRSRSARLRAAVKL